MSRRTRRADKFRKLLYGCIEANFAPKYVLFSIFRDLQDVHTFALLQIQKNFLKFVENITIIADVKGVLFRQKNSQCSISNKFKFFTPIFIKNYRNFAENLPHKN